MTNSNLRTPPHEKPAKKTKIEFSIPEHLLDDFAKEAGERFGFKKGSKSDLFIAMWNEYQKRKNRPTRYPYSGVRNSFPLRQQASPEQA